MKNRQKSLIRTCLLSRLAERFWDYRQTESKHKCFYLQTTYIHKNAAKFSEKKIAINCDRSSLDMKTRENQQRVYKNIFFPNHNGRLQASHKCIKRTGKLLQACYNDAACVCQNVMFFRAVYRRCSSR